MTNTTKTTAAQIAAFQSAFAGENLYRDEAVAAIAAAREALEDGQAPIRAAIAAACVLYNGFAGYRLETRTELLPQVVTALMRADASGERIGPRGFLNLGEGCK